MPELDLAAENELLRRRLGEAEETIRALLRSDALREACLPHPAEHGGPHPAEHWGLHPAEPGASPPGQLFRAVFEGVDDGILLLDSCGVFLDANPAACSLLGVAKAEVIGRRTEDFAAPGYDARLERQRIRDQGKRRGVVQIRLPDGSLRDLDYRASRDILPGLHLSVIRDVTELNVARNALLANVTERRRTEEALRASEERYRLLFESSPLPIWLVDIDSQCLVAVNGAALELFGYPREEFLNLTLSVLLSEGDAMRLERQSEDSSDFGVGFRHRRQKRKDGTLVELNVMSQTFMLDARLVALVIAQDLTQKHRLEAQLAQSRKLEAIGILAGGVAHDFNNLLSIIITYTTFALESLAPGDPLRADIEQVGKAGDRAVSLTRQLLAFSRRQILEPTLLDLNTTIGTLVPMLRRLVGENIDLTLLSEPRLGQVSADAGQIQQVIMNLVVNARDAMPSGGELTIETANVTGRNRLGVGPLGLKTGAHVKLTVSDTGSGMDETTRERIFEPFFTTKEQGKGTGLGLSTVLGIVEQSGGKLDVHSELGKGTRFMVYLPQVARTAGVAAVQSMPPPLAAPAFGSETILVVEDDEQVRTLTRSILRRHGYHVLVASNPGEAFLISEQHPGPIELLLTDVVMPRMNGRQLAERLAPTRPDMKVLFMTGYTDDAVVRQGVFDADMALLQKPITPDTLTRRVRSVLDDVRPSERGA